MCQYLRAEQYPWDASACACAAGCGHIDTLLWLREQGCPWDVETVCLAAAAAGCTLVIEYMLRTEPAAATAAQLTGMLNAAGAHSGPATAKWLRQLGAGWPTELRYDGCPWRDDVLQWARDEGCTSSIA
jgi:hypothetical protein